MPKTSRNTASSPKSVIYAEPFCERLAEWLANHPEVTMAGLERAAGLPTSTVRQLVTGKNTRPNIGMARALCAAMGTNLGEFMLPERSRQEQEILNLTTQLRDEEIQLILDLTKGLADTRRTEPKRHFAKTG